MTGEEEDHGRGDHDRAGPHHRDERADERGRRQEERVRRAGEPVADQGHESLDERGSHRTHQDRDGNIAKVTEQFLHLVIGQRADPGHPLDQDRTIDQQKEETDQHHGDLKNQTAGGQEDVSDAAENFPGEAAHQFLKLLSAAGQTLHDFAGEAGQRRRQAINHAIEAFLLEGHSHRLKGIVRLLGYGENDADEGQDQSKDHGGHKEGAGERPSLPEPGGETLEPGGEGRGQDGGGQESLGEGGRHVDRQEDGESRQSNQNSSTQLSHGASPLRLI